jgi:hypothetical protein
MKKWAWIVALLYGLIIVVLTLPMVVGAFWDFGKTGNTFSKEEIKGMFLNWPYWLGIVIFFLSQAALLFVHVRVVEKRPITRRTILLPVVSSAFLTGLLGAGLWLAIMETIRGEKFIDEEIWSWIALAVLAITWFVWGFVFYRWSKKYEPVNFIEKICRYLFRGSILELLIAVPTHIVARYKNYCCAGFGTFVGIVFGLAIMLFSFGPGVFFLFVERWRRLHPQKNS